MKIQRMIEDLKKRGMKQCEIAKHIGVDPSRIARWKAKEPARADLKALDKLNKLWGKK